MIVVLEFKVGAKRYLPADIRQVETYALDLRDFHSTSQGHPILPVLCATDSPVDEEWEFPQKEVGKTAVCNASNLGRLLLKLAEYQRPLNGQLELSEWQEGAYSPVPTIIEAAELLYAGHQVREIANSSADPENLGRTTNRLIHIIEKCRNENIHAVIFVTGVPGSGKTLAGLNAVHDPRFSQNGISPGAYLSGNTPLVSVLREALAADKKARSKCTLESARRSIAAEIQGLMDFLREYLDNHPDQAPVDHVVIFDEAQRAWDAEYGAKKFNRPKSEASLFLEIMGRHQDWAVIVALVGGGQEINRGELGISEWGRALDREVSQLGGKQWRAFASPEVLTGDEATVWQRLFEGQVPNWVTRDHDLHLPASVRSYGCRSVSIWVNHLLRAEIPEAQEAVQKPESFPVFLTRSLGVARQWLRANARGNRRCGLLASSGAKRLRGEGLGVSVGADDLVGVTHWFLQPPEDIRSSYALEVTANEYACQGLELDYVGVCWGGDFQWDSETNSWSYRSLNGPQWQQVRNEDKKRWITNKYRVLMTRARLGTVIWIPSGDVNDVTRNPARYNDTAAVLLRMGASNLDEEMHG